MGANPSRALINLRLELKGTSVEKGRGEILVSFVPTSELHTFSLPAETLVHVEMHLRFQPLGDLTPADKKLIDLVNGVPIMLAIECHEDGSFAILAGVDDTEVNRV